MIVTEEGAAYCFRKLGRAYPLAESSWDFNQPKSVLASFVEGLVYRDSPKDSYWDPRDTTRGV